LALKAFAEAEVRFRSALELLEEGEEREPAELVAALCGLGESQRNQVNPEFRQTLLDAAGRAVELGHTALLVRAVLANTRGFASLIGGVDLERVAFIEQALARVGPEPSADRARLLALLAEDVAFMGDNARRLALAEEAEAMARSMGDDELLCNVLCSTGFSSFAPDRMPALLERSREGARLADASGDPTRRVIIRVFLAGALQTAGALADSAAMVQEMVSIAEDEGAPHIVWTARCNTLRLLILAGRLDEAEAMNNELLVVGQELGQPDAEPWWAGVLVGLVWLRGQQGTVADAVGAFAEQYPRSMTWRCAHAWSLAGAGRLHEATEIIAAHHLTPTGVLAEPWPYQPSTMLAYAAWDLKDTALSADAVVALTPYRHRWAHYYLVALGPVSWPLGLALAGSGSFDEALDALEEALAAVQAEQLPAYVMKIRFDLAEVLLRRGLPTDAARAAQLLAEARVEAVALGATGMIERMDALVP
jgi:tetratricopeptide (TPR) repeat protein